MSITPDQYSEHPNAYAPRAGRANVRPPIKEATHAAHATPRTAEWDQRVTAADVLEARWQQVVLSCKGSGTPLPFATFEDFEAYEKRIDEHTASEHQRLVAFATEHGLPVSDGFEMPRAPSLTAFAKIVLRQHGLVDERNVVWVADKDAKVPECAASWTIGYDSRAECGD